MPRGTIILTPNVSTAKEKRRSRARAAALLLLGALLAVPGQAQESADADEQQLQQAGVRTDAAGLLEFFRQRSLKETERPQLEGLIRQLDSESYSQREQAQRQLISRGPPALPFLRQALTNSPLEVVQRAQECIRKIESAAGPEQATAAARLLTLRQPPEAVETLLNYLPFADDDTVEEAVLTGLGALAVRQGKVAPELAAALHDTSPVRRAAAAYVLGRHGNLEQREAVRQLLVDSDTRVQEAAASGLVGKRLWQAGKENATADEAVLRDQKLPVEEEALLEFLHRHTLSAAAQGQIKQLIFQLGDDAHRRREEASSRLVAQGSPALPFLREALGHGDLEVARRAQLCIDKISRGPGPLLPTAVVRLLARHSSDRAIPALLNYLPFAEDEMVEDEVLNSLCVLSVRQVKVDPLLPAALHDAQAGRRAAAAYVLGRVGSRADCAALPALLRDSDARVRLRAAQGLIAARDKTAIPELIDLVAQVPAAGLWQLDDLLHRLAGERGPDVTLAEDTPEARKKAVSAWAGWWRQQEAGFDLARVSLEDHRLGLLTICEYDSVVGKPGGRVWECGRDGKTRWQIKDVFGPMDAQVLPGGRVLIAENTGQRVTERDLAGNVKWEYRVANNPIACQRLPNGNTFIATYNQVLEVTPGQKLVYSYNQGPAFYIFSARKLRNGHILCMTAQGAVLELDPVTGKELSRIHVTQNGGWCGVEPLPSGRYLVALMSLGKVMEVDAAGRSYWECSLPGVFRATRLPNGHTLTASMTLRKVVEFDRAGNVRWEKTCEGRPWQVRYR